MSKTKDSALKNRAFDSEGWFLTEAQRAETTVEIQKNDELDIFIADTSAVNFVIERAFEDKSYHHALCLRLAIEDGDSLVLSQVREYLA